MRVPTIEVRRPDGKLVKINESDRFAFAKMGCDMDPHKQQHTSGGEQTAQEQEQLADYNKIEDTPDDTPYDTQADIFVRKTVKLPTPDALSPQTTLDDCIAHQDGLNDLIVN